MVHQLVHDLGDDFSVSAILAHWHAATSVLTWVRCGHPPPLLVGADGAVSELPGPAEPALGLSGRDREFRSDHRLLRGGDRVVFHSDGVIDRPVERTGQGFGRAGVEAAVAASQGASAAATARSIQQRVVGASTELLEDDATVLVLRKE